MPATGWVGPAWHGPLTETGELYSDPAGAASYRPPVEAGPLPPTPDEIADLRAAVLRLTERAVRAGRASVAAELRAAVGPLADAESAARRGANG